MNRDQMEGSWKQVAGKAKEHWGRLTGDSIAIAEARRDQLAGRVLERRGNSKQLAERQLRDFLYRNRNWYLLNR